MSITTFENILALQREKDSKDCSMRNAEKQKPTSFSIT